MEKIFQNVWLDNLPKKSKNRTDWEHSIGYSVKYQYGDTNGIIEIIDYKKIPEKHHNEILVKCNGNEKWVSTDCLLNPNIGNIVSNRRNIDFVYDIGDIIYVNKNSLKVLDKKRDGRKQYFLECLTCHSKNWYTENHILNAGNYLCGVCGQHFYKEGYNDIVSAASWMIPYFQGGEEEARQYSIHSTCEIYPICPECGKISPLKRKINYIFQNKGFVCDCQLYGSYGEKLVGEVLKQNNIEYIHNKTLEWSNGKRYDYILNKYHIIIEVDGEYGHGFYQKWKSYEQSEKEFSDDEYKNNLASQNGFSVLRLVYLHEYKNEFIDEIKTGLPKIFWENTNWAKAILDALHKSKYDICVEYEESDKSSLFMDYLCKKYDYCKESIRKILKFGNENGWCVYPKKKMSK